MLKENVGGNEFLFNSFLFRILKNLASLHPKIIGSSHSRIIHENKNQVMEIESNWNSIWEIVLTKIASWDSSLYPFLFELLEAMIVDSLINISSQESLWKLTIFEIGNEASTTRQLSQFLFSFLSMTEISSSSPQNTLLLRETLSNWLLKSIEVWNPNKTSTDYVNEIDPQLIFYLLDALNFNGWRSEIGSPQKLPDQLNHPLYHVFKSQEHPEKEEYDQIHSILNISSHNNFPFLLKILKIQLFKSSFTHLKPLSRNFIPLSSRSYLHSQLLLSLQSLSAHLLEQSQSILQKKKKTVGLHQQLSNLYLLLLKSISFAQILLHFLHYSHLYRSDHINLSSLLKLIAPVILLYLLYYFNSFIFIIILFYLLLLLFYFFNSIILFS